MFWSVRILKLNLLLCISLFATVIESAEDRVYPLENLLSVNYDAPKPLRMNMSDTREINATVTFNRTQLNSVESIVMYFDVKTLSPQFEVLEFLESPKFFFNLTQLKSSQYIKKIRIPLKATYIGHAIIKPDLIRLDSKNETANRLANVLWKLKGQQSLRVVITKYEGIWGQIFVYSVILFVLISYVNLGSQLDRENLVELIKKPAPLVFGFLITVFVMPSVSFLIAQYFFGGQLLYRVGSFVFACGPAASASTLWTVMLDADKELSVGLQVVSTMGALITMPMLLYIMESAKLFEASNFGIKVPYMRLVQTLASLMVALIIGSYFIGRYKRAQEISRKIFRPLTFAVLLFIIVFSSIIYWYIYQMFDWNITFASFLITSLTYLVSGLLGWLVRKNHDQAIAISISSTYKNSGIAFAVLMVAFDAPDTYIAYVPCLTQVVTTSLALYLFYTLIKLANYIKRRNQPEPIQATSGDDADPKVGPEGDQTKVDEAGIRKTTRSGSAGSGKSATRSEENDEFVAMNIIDVISSCQSQVKRLQERGRAV